MALILSRREGQRLLITTPEGRRIWVEVSRVSSARAVQLAVTADREVIVLREEVIPEGEKRE